MGCDIHAYAEKRNKYGTYEEMYEVDFGRNYSLFGWLAGVRNYSGVTPIKLAQHELPNDVSTAITIDYDNMGCDAHSASWLTIKELLEFDYDAIVEDRRVMRNNNGGCTCDEGEGVKMTYNEFLGEWWLEEIQKLHADGVERIVFWFDN